MKLYEVRRLSAGAAAELAGLSYPEFLQRQGENNVNAFALTEDELLRDAAACSTWHTLFITKRGQRIGLASGNASDYGYRSCLR